MSAQFAPRAAACDLEAVALTDQKRHDSNMSSRREGRGPAPRGDRELLADEWTMALLAAVERRLVGRSRPGAAAPFLLGEEPVPMRLLAREGLVHAPIAGPPTLAPRGARLLGVARGELPTPMEP